MYPILLIFHQHKDGIVLPVLVWMLHLSGRCYMKCSVRMVECFCWTVKNETRLWVEWRALHCHEFMLDSVDQVTYFIFDSARCDLSWLALYWLRENKTRNLRRRCEMLCACVCVCVSVLSSAWNIWNRFARFLLIMLSVIILNIISCSVSH